MGQKGQETRARLLDATQDLIESGGYFAAGLNQIIAASGAPRGSVYFHFRGGKDEMIVESLTRAADAVTTAIKELDTGSPRELVQQTLRLLGDRLEQSDWQKGCPIATVALDVSGSNDAVRQACSAAYTAWERALRDRIGSDDLATTVLALIEGAILLARTHRSREPLERAGRVIATLL
ncbi:TetR/AcrR family transcriptional regulator [Nonomuraea sediminis]|uniref:TetR/AcrR family transcriptional regulator n=1 Tax=Nonomuraea sediminis TaxID=2835864 RepID=UPI001BDD8EDE|nr:TetR/AcrR family transcriptional regulator [Nonomuraea sediminis]